MSSTAVFDKAVLHSIHKRPVFKLSLMYTVMSLPVRNHRLPAAERVSDPAGEAAEGQQRGKPGGGAGGGRLPAF